MCITKKDCVALLRTKTEPFFYIHEIRGAVYTSWVSEQDKRKALTFSLAIADSWRVALSTMTGFELEFTRVYEKT